MGTFYGGVSHTPLSSLVLVCELAGSYDLLVPLMLAEGIAFIVLRKKSLYRAQVTSQRESPVHGRSPAQADLLRTAQVVQVMRGSSALGVAAAVAPEVAVKAQDDLRTAAQALLRHKLREIPVVDGTGQIVGMLDEADISRWYLEATTKTPPPQPPPLPDDAPK